MTPEYVSSLQDGRIETSGLRGKTYRFGSEAELAAVVERLIAEGFAFVHQPARWPPAAVLEDLQERGLLAVPFNAITWRGPDDFMTFRVPAE